MLAVAHSLFATKLVPLVLAGVGFGLLITIHEFGHFLFCKLFGIGTPIFSIGFGPILLDKQIGETNFRLSLIPLGGYCMVQGAEEVEMADLSTERKKLDPAASFDHRPYWQKALVLLGGILFNIAFAYIAFTGIHLGSRPKLKTDLVISQVVKKSAAAEHNITRDSVLVGYDDITFSSDNAQLQTQLKTFLNTIAQRPGGTLTLALRAKNGGVETQPVTLKGEKTGSLGIGIEMKHMPIPGLFEHDTLGSAIRKGITMTHAWISQTANGIAKVFRRRTLQGIGGPIAMFSQTFKMAQDGFRAFLNFLGIISVSLAVLNLLPLGALDGGQLLFATIEFITRRRLPMKFKEIVIITSWVLFLLLVVVLSYRDILRIFGY